MKTFKALLLTVLFASFLGSKAQMTDKELSTVENLNWPNLNWKEDKMLGASVDLAYEKILQNKKAKRTVIVAVLDNGIDFEHEDLAANIWINSKEIPNNNIDDDQNGYVDDIYGWNFLGNSKGENISKEHFEYTRIYLEYLSLIEQGYLDSNNLEGKEAEVYKEAEKMYQEELEKREEYLKSTNNAISLMVNAKKLIKNTYGIDIESIDDLKKVNSAGNPDIRRAKAILFSIYDQGFTMEQFQENKEFNEKYTLQYLNLDLNPREVVGDDPFDIENGGYGNPDVKGPNPDHGTACAGLIGAVRNNDIGINGVAENVKIMCLRTTPDGDERDKDVALAILYAVDNGAHIINMSFGKQFSPQKEMVDLAIKYAEKKGVLVVHSSGNSAQDLRIDPAFPNETYLDGTNAKNMITVGASSFKPNKRMIAVFSNYGKGIVDILGPGTDIMSLDTGNTYSEHSGTSFSGPIVSGVAAVVWAYYPDLSVEELISLLITSSKTKRPKKVYPPNLSDEKMKKVKLEEICSDGGVVNLYEALLSLEPQLED